MRPKFAALLLAAVPALVGLQTQRASAQEYYLGQIFLGGWNFCPRGSAGADGQLLPIAQNQALFSLYGTTYGGDGRTTFKLPDLRGRSALHNGTGPGLSTVNLGASGGRETFTQNVNTLAAHNHVVVNTATATAKVGNGPAGAFGAGDHLTATAPVYAGQGGPNQDLADGTVTVAVNSVVQNTGGSQSVNIRDPYQAIQYCVALTGIFPSRN